MHSAITELCELSSLLSSENPEEIDSFLSDKTDLICNKIIKIEDVRELLQRRVDFEWIEVEKVLKNYA